MPGFFTFATFAAISRPTRCAMSAPPCYLQLPTCSSTFTNVFRRTLADASAHQTLKLRLFFMGLGDGSEQRRTSVWRRGGPLLQPLVIAGKGFYLTVSNC